MKKNGLVTVSLDTLGCKINQAESELLARELGDAGYQVVPPDGQADIYVLNTCSVTHIADRKARHLLRLARRRRPHALVVATGCYAERAPEELAGIKGVGLVLDNSQKADLVAALHRQGYSPSNGAESPPDYHTTLRTRAFLKIQDGCHNFCTYCIVPLLRRQETSVPVDEVLAQVRQRLAEGYQEVVLTGVEIGTYDDSGVNLGGLLKWLLAETAIPRLRLSSLQPQEVTPELLGLWRDERLCRHFHLSLQSGCNSVLKRMNRRYTAQEYAQAVALIRTMLPDVAITTDVIVGFPGETEAEFAASYELCRQAAFARIHVFPFSPREGTLAAAMPGQVSDGVKQGRMQQMLALAEASAVRFRQQFLGKTVPVLWEKQANGFWSGLTDNYIKVYARSDCHLENRIMPAKLAELAGDGVRGEIVPL
ncbi:MAG: tRNA (N(6)-L-threonylcarbamoyladenosine(37)-C(2))-methylthiotransferase MtaB [Chloroflexi bacterium]|nr:tRNA (N(6)-L-threonylcarbamoyladenosine(37)-C(2))-methylthiotransferase MtaB [Chloroflexota bacterium]